VVGVVISAWDRFVMNDFLIPANILAIFAGGWIDVQRALNGQINSFLKKSFATSQLKFITSFGFPTFLLILRSFFTDHSIMNLTSGP